MCNLLLTQCLYLTPPGRNENCIVPMADIKVWKLSYSSVVMKTEKLLLFFRWICRSKQQAKDKMMFFYVLHNCLVLSAAIDVKLQSSTHYTFCAPSCLFALVSCTLEMVLELLFKFDFWALPFAPLLPITSQSWSTLSKNPIICMFLAILALFICYLKEEAR